MSTTSIADICATVRAGDVQKLCLGGRMFGDSAILQLAEALQANFSLTTLDLAVCAQPGR